jgi:putative peptide zinc metalloprotease protein
MASNLPTFRKDLEVTPRLEEGGSLGYLVKDKHSAGLFGFREEDYFICQQLDGNTSLEAVQTAFQAHFGIPLQLNMLEAFVRHLDTLGFLVSPTKPKKLSWFSIFFVRESVNLHQICNPDQFLSRMARCFSWCFTSFFLTGLLLTIVLALGVLLRHWDSFVYELFESSEGIRHLGIIILGIFFTNFLGEFAKAITCKHYGGYVYGCGVFFGNNIMPRFYSDLSYLLLLSSKTHRIRILSAGLIAELLFWGVSILFWGNTLPWSTMHSFWLFFSLPSIVFFLLNLIPLLPRDGNMLLTNWLEIPDLRNRAISVAGSWIFRRPLPEPLSSREVFWMRWYGLLGVAFEIAVLAIILFFVGSFLINELRGVGALMFTTILSICFWDQIKELGARLPSFYRIMANEAGGPVTPRQLVYLGLSVLILLILLLPFYPFEAGGDFRLQPSHQLGIRAQVTSEIASVLVAEGDMVEKGQPLAVLLGKDQKNEVETTQALLEEARSKLALLEKGKKPEEIAIAEQEVKRAATNLDYWQAEAERFTKMFEDKAVSDLVRDKAFNERDMAQEQLAVAKKNLELAKSGFREEEIEAAKAEVQRLEAELALAQNNLHFTTLVSPVKGRIITPYLSQKVGQVLVVGDLFAVVEDPQAIIAEIEVPEEDIGEVKIGANVKLKMWYYPTKTFKGKVITIGPTAYEKSLGRVERTLSEKEWLFERKSIFREEGKVVRVLSKLPNEEGLLKTDMTGYAKIETSNKPVIVAFTRWLVRFVLVEIWSWIP